jgi:hypothetical protein
VSEFWRVLEPGGTLILCFTCPESLQHKPFARLGLSLYKPEEVQSLLMTAGFSQIEVRQEADAYRQFVSISARKRSIPAALPSA